MSTPNRIYDGAPPHGTTDVTTSEAVTYHVNKETITPQWAEAENRTATGGPNQMLMIKGRYKYSGEWQLASGSSLPPTSGATFSRTVENESAAITFVVGEVTVEKTNEAAIRVANVSAVQYVLGITTA